MTELEQRAILLSMMHRAPGCYRRKPVSRLAGTKRPVRRTRAHRLTDAHYYRTADKRCSICGYTFASSYRELWVGKTCIYCTEDEAV